MAPDLAAALTIERDIPLQLGASYANALTGPVPRAIWSSKPRALDTLLMSRLFPDLAQRNIGYSFSFVAEPYFNFSWPGVFVATCLMGIVFGSLYRWLLAHPDNRFVQVCFATMLPFLIPLTRSGLAANFNRYMLVVTPLVLCFVFARVRRHGFR